jgi:Glycosyl hydrolase catalytic core
VSLAVVTCAAAATFAVAHTHRTAATTAIRSVPTSASARVPPVTHSGIPTPSAGPAPSAVPAAAQPPATPPAATTSSPRKGVGTWNFTGVQQALAASGVSWYYNWGSTPNGISAPAGVSYVPMIWGAADVTAATLAQVKQEGNILLGFNEPDQSGQSNMSVAQALALWPQLEATGMTLGSPAVSSGAATPGGWLDQFMTGAQERGYRVNFITVHWYGGDFSTGSAVAELENYLQAINAMYHLPIWVTEFALTNFSGATPTYPTEAQQAAFVTAATNMLDGLSYVQRYAWFALPTSSGSGTTGLFNAGPTATQVGQAFESAS